MARSKKVHPPGARWKDSDKKRAVAVYKALGSLNRTAEITGIPGSTVEMWARTDWWKEALMALKAEDSSVLEDATTNLAKQASQVVSERLTNGDFVLNRDGELVRKPVSGRDAAIIMGISMQKRKELMESPEQELRLGTAERLLKLVEQFTRFASAKEIKGVLSEERDDQRSHEVAVIEHNEHHNAKFTELQEELQTGSSDGEFPEETAEVGAQPSPEGDDSSRESQAQ